MSKIIQLKDADGNVYPQLATNSVPINRIEGYNTQYFASGGTYTATLETGTPYFVIVNRNNTASTNYDGLYLVSPHTATGHVYAIKAATNVTVTISSLTLTVAINNNYTSVIVFPFR